MSLSADGHYLLLTGYDNNPLPFGTALPVPTASGNANGPRSIAEIAATGAIQTMAFTAGSTRAGELAARRSSRRTAAERLATGD